jgi:hypothetical protein
MVPSPKLYRLRTRLLLVFMVVPSIPHRYTTKKPGGIEIKEKPSGGAPVYWRAPVASPFLENLTGVHDSNMLAI